VLVSRRRKIYRGDGDGDVRAAILAAAALMATSKPIGPFCGYFDGEPFGDWPALEDKLRPEDKAP
jgi:hypothetical protein